jgi:predicted S18 family serine protease
MKMKVKWFKNWMIPVGLVIALILYCLFLINKGQLKNQQIEDLHYIISVKLKDNRFDHIISEIQDNRTLSDSIKVELKNNRTLINTVNEELKNEKKLLNNIRKSLNTNNKNGIKDSIVIVIYKDSITHEIVHVMN